MLYHSTRGDSESVSGAKAIASGIAPDGGLYVPESIPKLPQGWVETLSSMSYPSRAAYIISMYLEDFGDLWDMTSAAYTGKFDKDKPAPLRHASDGTHYLELYRGPTSAFKDMALQLLPRLLTYSLKATGEKREACILVATSGDTGKAALEGFRDVDGVSAMVFYPVSGVSDTQRLQMTTQEGKNVFVCAVDGNFDDAQTGVKAIFTSAEMREKLDKLGYVFSSANSINWGRLVPQIAYYVSAYLDMLNDGYASTGSLVDFCVPTGNFGNILAAWYAREMGVPIGRLICASNRNNILTDFFTTGVYDTNREFYATTSPSMDILVSSNLERALYHFGGNDSGLIRSLMGQLRETGRFEVPETMKQNFAGVFASGYCNDEQAGAVIKDTFGSSGVLLDPHTAVAKHVADRNKGENPCVIVATASPYKFTDSVCNALGLGDNSMAALFGHTGEAIPVSLLGLDKKQVRFKDVCEKDALVEPVLSFLGM